MVCKKSREDVPAGVFCGYNLDENNFLQLHLTLPLAIAEYRWV